MQLLFFHHITYINQEIYLYLKDHACSSYCRDYRFWRAIKHGAQIRFFHCDAEVLAAIPLGSRPLDRSPVRNKNPRSKRSVMKTIKPSCNLCPPCLSVCLFPCYCWSQVYVTRPLSQKFRPKFRRCREGVDKQNIWTLCLQRTQNFKWQLLTCYVRFIFQYYKPLYRKMKTI
jgi:hypothetical protein